MLGWSTPHREVIMAMRASIRHSCRAALEYLSTLPAPNTVALQLPDDMILSISGISEALSWLRGSQRVQKTAVLS